MPACRLRRYDTIVISSSSFHSRRHTREEIIMASAGRIAKEITAICKPDSTSGVIARVAPDDLRVPSCPGWRHLIGTINGPEGTPYEGGVFDVDILIPKQYPFEPPKMQFITRIWHPNISSQTGAICLVSIIISVLWNK
jgi:ubiquitin-conjugating enzyme (huntingtin interacting protein 2)